MDRKITEKSAEKIFEDNPIPEDLPVKSAPFVLTAEVDMTPQKLRVLRPYGKSTACIPGFLPGTAQAVLRLLFDCFEKQGEVKEGLIGDVLWGFAQSPCLLTAKGLVPAPPEFTYAGLVQLQRLGYIKFQAPDGAFLGPESSQLEHAWVRYEPKLLDMVYE